MKESPKFKAGLKVLFESYTSINVDKGQPSSYMLVRDEPAYVKTYCLVACHAGMKNVDPNVFDRLVTAVPKAAKNDLAYLSMLINGPFRCISDLIHLIQDAETGLWYLECTDLDKWPADVLYNFCIASRVSIEWPHLLDYWASLVTLGYDPTLAFLISQSNSGKEFAGERAWDFDHHMWFDASSDWRLILKGDPATIAPSFKSSPPSCIPCNRIWGSSADYIKLLTATDKEIAQFFDMEPVVPAPPLPKPELKLNQVNPHWAAVNGVQVQEVINNIWVQLHGEGPPQPWAAPAGIVAAGVAPPIIVDDFDDLDFDDDDEDDFNDDDEELDDEDDL